MDAGYETNRKIIHDVITRYDLVRYLKEIGLSKGMLVYVQSSLEKYAYINGGIQTLIDAIMEVITYEGTLVCASFSESVVDPSCVQHITFQRDVYDEIRESIPCFNKKKTRSESSLLSDQMMHNEGVYRSNHPTHSCVAIGKYAKLICDRHPLHFSLGRDSFLDKIVELNGYVLLLGEAYKDCDIFKYASSLSNKSVVKIITSPIEKNGKKEFMSMLDVDYTYKGSDVIEQMLKERNVVKENFIGDAHCYFFKAKEASVLAQGYYNSLEEL